MITSLVGSRPKMSVDSRSDSEKRRRRKPTTITTTRKTSVTLSRTLALEQAYVHDVYSIIASNAERAATIFAENNDGIINSSATQPHVKQFLSEFESGSILLDIGCADGHHLTQQSDLLLVGLERCAQWFQDGSDRCQASPPKHVVLGDTLYLPFRDEFFDGVLCCSVLHHLSTYERRVEALKVRASRL